jgi:phosphotriesterase-related protein
MSTFSSSLPTSSWIDPNVISMMTQWHYLHIHDDVLPYLREQGVTDGQIDDTLIHTPRRYFEDTGPY